MIRRHSRTAIAALALGALALGACGDNGTQPEPTPLGIPANVQASTTGPTSVEVTWGSVTGAESYVVQRAPGSGGTFETVGMPASTSFDEDGLDAASAYRYRVAAKKGTETSSYSGEVAITTGDKPRLTITTDITADRTFHADTVYVLGNFIHVADGATLTVEAGTRIEGQPQSALFILRGAKLNAVGTADAPIVLTSASPVGQRQPGDWGGLLFIGNGIINRAAPVLVEGTGTNSSNYTIDYGGGTDNTDSSGHLEYVRVEFAGYGPAPDAELNAFTFAAVGAGTEMHYLQAVAGLDDSYEFWGGAADLDHIVSYESGDDHFDMAEGYQGHIQYAIALQSTIIPPRAGAGNTSNDPEGIENDGCHGSNCLNGEASQPFTIPVIANFTLVGTGPGVVPAGGGFGMMLRRGTGGFYINGVVARWPNAAIAIRDSSTNERIQAGLFGISNLVLTDNATTFESGDARFTVDETTNHIDTASGDAASLFAAMPTATSSTTAGDFDWTPASGSLAESGGLETFTGELANHAGPVTGTAFRGAVDPAGPKWWQGWTYYARN